MPLTLTHAKNNTVADFTGTVTVGNSSGGSQSALATNLVRPSDWNSNHVFVPDNVFEPFPLPNTNSTLSAPGIGTWYIDPIHLPHGLNSGVFAMPMSNAAGFLAGTTFSAASTGSISRYQTLYNKLALYKQGSGASSSRLEKVWETEVQFKATWEMRVSNPNTSNVTISNYLTIGYNQSFDQSGNVTTSTRTASGTTSVGASTAASTVANGLITGAVAYVSGARMDFIPAAQSFEPGQYFLAHMLSSSSSSTGTNYSQGTMFSTHSRLGLLENNLQAYKAMGESVSNSTTQPLQFHGYLATTTISASSIIGSGDIRGTTGRAYFNHRRAI